MSDVLTRAAPLRAEGETITAVVATATPVDRGDHIEVLDMRGVDLAAFNALAVCVSHRSRDALDVIGRCANPRREGDSIVVDIILSRARDVDPIRERIADGTLTDVSIGYRVAQWREDE